MHAQECFPEDAIELSKQAKGALEVASQAQRDDLTVAVGEIIATGIDLSDGIMPVGIPFKRLNIIRQFFASESGMGIMASCPELIAVMTRKNVWGLRIELLVFRTSIH